MSTGTNLASRGPKPAAKTCRPQASSVQRGTMAQVGIMVQIGTMVQVETSGTDYKASLLELW